MDVDKVEVCQGVDDLDATQARVRKAAQGMGKVVDVEGVQVDENRKK